MPAAPRRPPAAGPPPHPDGAAARSSAARLNPAAARGEPGPGWGGMALSSRAHAFSVEALVGRSAKRKGPDGRDEESGAGCRQSRRASEPGW